MIKQLTNFALMRGIDYYHNVWVYGFPSSYSLSRLSTLKNLETGRYFNVRTETLCRGIGYTDVLGRVVFERDIVSIDYQDTEYIDVIQWYDGAFYCGNLPIAVDIFENSEGFRVLKSMRILGDTYTMENYEEFLAKEREGRSW